MSGYEFATDLLKSDAALANVDTKKYHTLAASSQIDAAKASLETKGWKVSIAENKAEALELLKKSAPKGASVYNGGSTTLVRTITSTFTPIQVPYQRWFLVGAWFY